MQLKGGERIGIALMLAQQVLFFIDTAAIHRLGGHVGLAQLGFVRSIGGLLLALCLAPTVGWPVFYTAQPGTQLLRTGATLGYAWILIWSLTRLSLSDATAFSYTQALYVAVLAPPILGEIVGRRRWSAIIVGLAGALLLIRPGFSELSPIYAAVLAGTSLNGLALVLNKYLARTDSTVTLLFYVNLGCTLGFLPAAAESWPPEAAPWLAVVATAGPIGMYVGILALRYAEATTLAPLVYVRLVLAMAAGSLIFGERLDAASIAGAAAIVLACLLADRRLFRTLAAPHLT
jgi:drug/metabolite transporter (DMT)-like permease